MQALETARPGDVVVGFEGDRVQKVPLAALKHRLQVEVDKVDDGQRAEVLGRQVLDEVQAQGTRAVHVFEGILGVGVLVDQFLQFVHGQDVLDSVANFVGETCRFSCHNNQYYACFRGKMKHYVSTKIFTVSRNRQKFSLLI